MSLPAVLAAVFVLLALPAAAAPPPKERPDPNAPRAAVVLAFQLTRTDAAGEKNDPAQMIGAPVLSTLDRSTGSIQITGGALDYAISVSPTVEAQNSVALLWTLQLSGKSLPGATGAALNGATRVLRDKTETVADLLLRDPKTGRSSAFRLSVKTTVTTEPGKAAAP